MDYRLLSHYMAYRVSSLTVVFISTLLGYDKVLGKLVSKSVGTL